MEIKERKNCLGFDKVIKYKENDFVCTVYEEPCSILTFRVDTPDVFAYPEADIIYDIRTKEIVVYWKFGYNGSGVLDTKIDAYLDNFKELRKFVEKVINDVKEKRGE